MQICVCGWHYYKEFYQLLDSIRNVYDIKIVSNRNGDSLGMPYTLRENTGLEWGAYSEFLSSYWDTKSNVLFMHDDVIVDRLFFEQVQASTHDQAWIFRNEKEYQRAYSTGRAFITSARFLNVLKSKRGIQFDKGNKGFIAPGYSWSMKPPKGCRDHNYGIRKFTNTVKKIGKEYPLFSVNKQIYFPHIVLGVRGDLTVC